MTFICMGLVLAKVHIAWSWHKVHAACSWQAVHLYTTLDNDGHAARILRNLSMPSLVMSPTLGLCEEQGMAWATGISGNMAVLRALDEIKRNWTYCDF